tara:strand:- start:611 stop:1894 length:1284 start_codon:yes stop_codon:yes gene_type:complete
MKKITCLLILTSFLLSGCARPDPDSIVYISGAGMPSVPVWNEVGARNNPSNNSAPLLDMPTPNPLQVTVLEEASFGYGKSRYYKVSTTIGSEPLVGWVAKHYVFSDKLGIFPKDGGHPFLKHPYYSLPLNAEKSTYSTNDGCNYVTNYHFAKKALERGRMRGEFETLENFNLRTVKELEIIEAHVSPKNIYYHANDTTHSDYDIDNQTLTISPFRTYGNQEGSDFNMINSCDWPGLPSSDLNAIQKINSSGYMLIKLNNDLDSYGIGESVVVKNLAPDTAKILDSEVKVSFIAFTNLKDTDYKNVSDWNSSGYTLYPKAFFTFNNVEVPYMFVYVPSQERVLASFFSDQYLNEGIIRDIQLILLKAGFDVGYPEGKFNQKFNDAIALAVKNNLISKSDVNNGYEKILIKLMTNNYCKEAYGHCVKTM